MTWLNETCTVKFQEDKRNSFAGVSLKKLQNYNIGTFSAIA
jgi:hypothetical protein